MPKWRGGRRRSWSTFFVLLYTAKEYQTLNFAARKAREQQKLHSSKTCAKNFFSLVGQIWTEACSGYDADIVSDVMAAAAAEKEAASSRGGSKIVTAFVSSSIPEQNFSDIKVFWPLEFQKWSRIFH